MPRPLLTRWFSKALRVCLLVLGLEPLLTPHPTWATPAERTCPALLAETVKFYPHGWENCRDLVPRDAFDITTPITDYYRHVSPDSLKTLVDFALENAAGHGSDGTGSAVSYAVYETSDHFIEITVRNRRVQGLPSTLAGRVFTASSGIENVPDSERDRARGVRGAGLPAMLRALKLVIFDLDDAYGEPQMLWREVGAPTNLQIEFLLRIPMSRRRPKLAAPIADEPGDFPSFDFP